MVCSDSYKWWNGTLKNVFKVNMLESPCSHKQELDETPTAAADNVTIFSSGASDTISTKIGLKDFEIELREVVAQASEIAYRLRMVVS